MAESPKKDPSAIILPFGKHKGKTVAELLAVDPQYADWVSAQAWVAERFAELHSAIISRGAGIDDSPEHNAIQGRFLDPAFREGVFEVLFGGAGSMTRAVAKLVKRIQNDKAAYSRMDRVRTEDGFVFQMANAERAAGCTDCLERIAMGEPPELYTDAVYEVKGVDVVFSYEWAAGGYFTDEYSCGLEIKPTLGDDYPSVMRQMKRLGVYFLVVGTYTGRGISEPQMREMFGASGITVIFVQEIEEAMRRAAAPPDPEWW